MLKFSPESHANFLSGYMDAVGRSFTTEAILYNLTARWLSADDDLELILGGKINERKRIANWSHEFHACCSTFLGTNGRDRLTFYLIDYICWFKEFCPEVLASRLSCPQVSDRELDSHSYLIDIDSGHSILIVMSKFEKPPAGA